MKKLNKYFVAGLLLTYSLYGGCDKNIEDVLNKKYSNQLIQTRKKVAKLVLKKSSELYNSLDRIDLEEKICGGEK